MALRVYRQSSSLRLKIVDGTRWYWEGGHFKSTLGDVVLEQVFGGQGIGFGLRRPMSKITSKRYAMEWQGFARRIRCWRVR